MAAKSPESARLLAYDCLTPFGDVAATHHALCEGRRALCPVPVLGSRGGDLVPLALMPGRGLDEAPMPHWLEGIRGLAARIPGGDWGRPGRPIIVTSSNFGVGSLYSYRHDGGDPSHLGHGAPFSSVEWLRCELGWGADITVFSHACVSAHLGLVHAARLLEQGLAEEVLVFSYDFLSPFVAGGFHALKILNGQMPAPYRRQETGSIALGDGAAFAVLTRDRGAFQLLAQSLYNELHHFTANKADGSGFAAVLEGLRETAGGRRLWLKGHGTGTLEAGRLEAESLGRCFPGAPLVGWKGSLGHTLGSCGLVELALAMESLRQGRAPGTVGTEGPCFIDEVATAPFATGAFDAVLCSSNAFGGAHAALLLAHA
jgi:hypothetical protein